MYFVLAMECRNGNPDAALVEAGAGKGRSFSAAVGVRESVLGVRVDSMNSFWCCIKFVGDMYIEARFSKLRLLASLLCSPPPSEDIDPSE